MENDKELKKKLAALPAMTENLSLKKAIRLYLNVSENLQKTLSKNPLDFISYQDEFNLILDGFSNALARFEENRSEQQVYKLKRFFARKLRKFFLYGHYIKSSFEKPYGYAGDFQIIDDIYLNSPTSIGFERLWDNYFLRMGPSISTRNRKDDFKRIIERLIVARQGRDVMILDLASGPCRDLKEVIDSNAEKMSRVTFHCFDFDENSINFAKKLLRDSPKVHFFKKNALRLALKKNIKDEIPHEYDFIFSTGLFDYLDERIATRLVENLYKVLKADGVMCISNYTTKDRNPWAHLMEWVAEWNLVYRTEEEFKQIFINSGFKEKNISLSYEALKIMQYCTVHKESIL